MGEAGFVVVVGDDAGAGGEGCFDPGWNAQALFDGFLREQAGGDHDGGVGGIGAAGDGGDDDGAVVEVGLGVYAKTFFHGVGDVAVAVGGFGSGVGRLDISVRRRVAAFALPADGLAVADLVGVGTEERGELFFEAGAGLTEEDTILRTFGAGDGWLDLGEVEGDGLRVLGFRRVGSMEQ